MGIAEADFNLLQKRHLQLSALLRSISGEGHEHFKFMAHDQQDNLLWIANDLLAAMGGDIEKLELCITNEREQREQREQAS